MKIELNRWIVLKNGVPLGNFAWSDKEELGKALDEKFTRKPNKKFIDDTWTDDEGNEITAFGIWTKIEVVTS